MSNFALILVLVPVYTMIGAQAPVPAQSTSANGIALLQAGKAAEARDEFEAVLSGDPANAEAQTGEIEASERLALDARAKGHMDDALRALLRAQGRVPHNGRLLFDLGILEEQMLLYVDADRSLAEAEQLSPADASVLYGVARVKMDLGQLSIAEQKMQAYLQLRPDDASAHFGLGRIYQIGLQFDKARDEFLRSVDIQPVQTEGYFELGDLALKQGKLDEAIDNFAKTLVRDPKHGGALEGTGEAYFKQKHYEQAKNFLERAAAAAPDYPPCHYYLGLTLARMGHKKESDQELGTASKLADDQNRQSVNHLRLIQPAANP